MRFINLVLAVFFGAAVSSAAAIAEVSYQLDIKPILDKKCVVCHACFDAPCQLNLTHALGLERGANRQPVYDGLRVTPASPTRLHFDAKTVEQWRQKNFFSILPEDRNNAGNKKMSILEYLLIDRGYYNLVVNFDVFGSVSHQAQTRLYFDLIRNDAERNFLRLLPKDARQRLMDRWYQGTAQLKLMTSYQTFSEKKPPAMKYLTSDPKRELLDRLIESLERVNARLDTINRRDQDPNGHAEISPVAKQSRSAIKRITATQAKELPALKFLPEVSFIRVFDSRGQREIYTVFRNRMHSNVAFMFGEDLRHKQEEDTLTAYPGILASYPNFIFNVAVNEIDDFVDTVLATDAERDFERAVVARWGVRRTHPRFWELFHDLTTYLDEHTPIDAGVMDMSRYKNL